MNEVFVFNKLAFSHEKKAVFHYKSSKLMTMLIDIKTENVVENDEEKIKEYLLNSLKPYKTESTAIVKTFDKSIEGAKKAFDALVEFCELVKTHDNTNNEIEIFGIKPKMSYTYRLGGNNELFVEIKGLVPRMVINYICKQIQSAV